MTSKALSHPKLPDSALIDILGRESALWLLGKPDLIEDELTWLVPFFTLPWRLVLCDIPSGHLANALQTESEKIDSGARYRGFVHVIASDPANTIIPSRSLPIFLTNGRDDSSDPSEASNLSRVGQQRRRLNMVAQLSVFAPKRLVIVGSSLVPDFDEVLELVASEFSGLVTFAIPDGEALEPIQERLDTLKSNSRLTFIQGPVADFASDVTKRCTALLPDASLKILVRVDDNDVREVDITDADLIEQTVLDRYELVRSLDLVRLSEHDLTTEDFERFFDKSQLSWRPYAAGLPWIADRSVFRKVSKTLENIGRRGSDENKGLSIVCQPGAGGTTIARAVAFEAAKLGYPTLVAKQIPFEPNATEIAGFIFRANQIIAHQTVPTDGSADSGAEDTPWLLVFDSQHWNGKGQALKEFLAELTRSGRSIVIVKIFSGMTPPELGNFEEIANLHHDLSHKQVEDLGAHLNRYLKPFGKDKSTNDWIRFWETHRPNIDTAVAAFWVTLEFWLRGHIELGQSVQEWVIGQFKTAAISESTRRVLLEIAAFSIERRAVPEGLLSAAKGEALPLSLALDEVRQLIPGLALVTQSTSTGRLWANSHDVLGRYLINGVYHDRPLLKALHLDEMQSAVELRLGLIAAIAERSAVAEKHMQPFARDLAIGVLKLDEESGNAEFFPYWREVLAILERVPAAVRKTSRTFNHHVAISRRRVAKGESFAATTKEKQYQLRKAIEELEFSLNALDETVGEENNLNLYNSLALAYQDLADVEIALGSPIDLVQEYRTKADETTRSALRENPSNPYVLETAAKNLLQKGRFQRNNAVTSASEALGYIFQATELESSQARQYQLSKLANQALHLLREEGEATSIAKMKESGDPMGFLAEAWLVLTADIQDIEKASPRDFSKENVRAAVDILREAPRHWLLSRTEYDLLCIVSPNEFGEQLKLLDELDSIPRFYLPMQLRLERAILLHFVGRHNDANEEFRLLRRDLKAQSVIVGVPDRLRWLTSIDGKSRLLCTARVLDEYGYGAKSSARVLELRNAQVPFVPQEFGKKNMPKGSAFKCHINFGAMGPFIRPPSPERR